MNIRKLWTKLFIRNNEADEIALHVSCATVRHRNPFESIEVNRNDFELNQDFINKWVAPFYSPGLGIVDEDKIAAFANASSEIDNSIVAKLLGDFNWRTRITGAFFAAIKKYVELEDQIGKHLLKSEVVYAGAGYCLALAIFGTDTSKDFLKKYLEYYLDRKDLSFDQAYAFCALEYVDKDAANILYKKYQEFVEDKPFWNLDDSRSHFSDSMQSIRRIQEAVSM
jgi:hypothetical protein